MDWNTSHSFALVIYSQLTAQTQRLNVPYWLFTIFLLMYALMIAASKLALMKAPVLWNKRNTSVINLCCCGSSPGCWVPIFPGGAEHHFWETPSVWLGEGVKNVFKVKLKITDFNVMCEFVLNNLINYIKMCQCEYNVFGWHEERLGTCGS